MNRQSLTRFDDAEGTLERRLEEIIGPLLVEIRRMRDVIASFEISHGAVIVFLQTIQELPGANRSRSMTHAGLA